MSELYPGQAYFHRHNPAIKRAEEKWMNNYDELPLYQCHKRVRAAKIKLIVPSPSIFDPADVAQVGGFIFPEAPDGVVPHPIEVSAAYLAKHEPQVGGYFVRYEDGYESFSPAEAFEGGYTRCADGV